MGKTSSSAIHPLSVNQLYNNIPVTLKEEEIFISPNK